MANDVRRMYIDGQWIAAEGRQTFEVMNPATREVAALSHGRRARRDPAGRRRRRRRLPRVGRRVPPRSAARSS